MSKWKIHDYDVEEVQQKIFEIFVEFDRICKKHNLAYTLEGGSLLGSILYQDFIPWDDDMDVIMLREDYDKFCQIANDELNAPFTFMNMEMSDEYPYLFGKLYNTDTVFLSNKTAHLNIPHGVFLDIFVEDNITPRTKNLQVRLVSAIGTVRYIKLGVEKLSTRHMFYAPLFLLSIPKLTKLANRVMKFYDQKQTDYIYPLCESVSTKPPLPRRMLTQLEEGYFHGMEVPVPVCRMWYMHKHYETPMEKPPESEQHPTHGVVMIEL